MRTFTKKGYGRIYVAKEEDIPKVIDIIKLIDEFEASYLPEDFVTPFQNYPSVVYVRKFSDMDINELTAACFNYGIHIFCFDAGNNEFPTTNINHRK